MYTEWRGCDLLAERSEAFAYDCQFHMLQLGVYEMKLTFMQTLITEHR